MKTEIVSAIYVGAYAFALYAAYSIYPFSGFIDPVDVFMVIVFGVPIYFFSIASNAIYGWNRCLTFFVTANIVVAVLVHPSVEIRPRQFLDVGQQHELVARIVSEGGSTNWHAKKLVKSVHYAILDDYVRRNEWWAVFFPPSLILILCAIAGPLAVSHVRRKEIITAAPPASPAAPPD